MAFFHQHMDNNLLNYFLLILLSLTRTQALREASSRIPAAYIWFASTFQHAEDFTEMHCGLMTAAWDSKQWFLWKYFGKLREVDALQRPLQEALQEASRSSPGSSPGNSPGSSLGISPGSSPGSSQGVLRKLSGSSLRQSTCPRPWNSSGSNKSMRLSAKVQETAIICQFPLSFWG